MVLDEVIDQLVHLRSKHGGHIPVFVNGEHGFRCPEKAKIDHFDVGESEITLGFDIEDIPKWLPRRNKAIQIGGY